MRRPHARAGGDEPRAVARSGRSPAADHNSQIWACARGHDGGGPTATGTIVAWWPRCAAGATCTTSTTATVGSAGAAGFAIIDVGGEVVDTLATLQQSPTPIFTGVAGVGRGARRARAAARAWAPGGQHELIRAESAIAHCVRTSRVALVTPTKKVRATINTVRVTRAAMRSPRCHHPPRPATRAPRRAHRAGVAATS